MITQKVDTVGVETDPLKPHTLELWFFILITLFQEVGT